MSRLSETTCIVLAGGLGTRLRSAVPDLPKCLAPVGARCFLEFQIDFLSQLGVDTIVLSLGYMADKVIEKMSTIATSARIEFLVEPELLGTGGAIAYAMNAFDLDEALVANGDTYLDADASDMMRPLDREAGESLRMAVVEVPDRSRFGGVDVDETGRVHGFREKGEVGGGLINAGFYRLCREALAADAPKKFSLETEVFPRLAAAGNIRSSRVQGSFIDIGVPSDYLEFCVRHAS